MQRPTISIKKKLLRTNTSGAFGYLMLAEAQTEVLLSGQARRHKSTFAESKRTVARIQSVLRENFPFRANFTLCVETHVYNSFTKALLLANTDSARLMLELENVARR